MSKSTTRILGILQDQQKFLSEEYNTKSYLNTFNLLKDKDVFNIEITKEKLLLVSTILSLIGPIKPDEL